MHLLDTLLQSSAKLRPACATVTDAIKGECLYALFVEERAKFLESAGGRCTSSVEQEG